jgi:hypothetical protein
MRDNIKIVHKGNRHGMALYEHGDDFLFSIKGLLFLDKLTEEPYASQEEFFTPVVTLIYQNNQCYVWNRMTDL